MDGQGPFILHDIKLLPQPRPREGESGQGMEGPNIQQQRGLEGGPKESGSVCSHGLKRNADNSKPTG